MSKQLGGNHLGLAISDQFLSACQIQKSLSGQSKLTSWGNINLPTGAVVNGHIKENNLVIDKLKHLLNHPTIGKFTTNLVVASLPLASSFLCTVKIPLSQSDKVKDLIITEISPQLPIHVKSASLVWHDVNKMPNLGLQEVTVMAAPTELLATYQKILQKTQLIPLAFEHEVMALTRTIKGVNDKIIILINDNNHSSSISLIKQGVVQSSQIIESKSPAPKTTHSQPKKKILLTKKITTTLPWPKIIQQTLASYQEYHNSYIIPDEIYLMGSKMNKAAAQKITQVLKTPTKYVNPWQGVKYPKDINVQTLTAYNTCLGLALYK